MIAPIPNITLPKNAANSLIDLADYFGDVENGAQLAYSFGVTVSNFQTNTGNNKFFDVFSVDNSKILTLDYADNVVGTAVIDVRATDSANESVETTFNVSLLNSIPVATNDTFTTDQDSNITISAAELLDNDRDDDVADNLSITRIINSANGTAVLNPEGNIEFTPAAGFHGTASFEYIVTDGIDDATGLVQVEVNLVNDIVAGATNLAPVLTEPIPNLTVNRNAPNSVVQLSDYFEDAEDADNLAYSFSASSSIQGGTSGNFFNGFYFNSSNKSLILDYADDVLGTSTITVQASDSENELIETSFTVSIVDSLDNVSNEAMITAVNDAIATNEDTPITVLASELLSNDIGGNLSISSVDSPLGGTATIDEYGNITFTPAANFYGNTSFEYTVSDGSSSATGLVSVDVAPINDAPALVKSIPNFTVTQNAPSSVIQLSDYFEDAENGDNLGYSLRVSSAIQTSPSGRFFDSFSLNQDRALTLNYADDVIGSSTITINASDGETELVETNFTVSVIGVNPQGDLLLGGDGNDYLVGQQGNDTINGGAGSDHLAGGEGSDRFVFNSPNDGVDTITDFSVKDDTFVFSAAGFDSNLASGIIGSQMFTVGNAAMSNEHRFIYDAGSGDLSYDSDGTGESKQVKIVSLNSGLALTHNNFYVEL
ncbi:MAG: tandem-95 repeat protein [Cyanobacteria bacterium J06621_8]